MAQGMPTLQDIDWKGLAQHKEQQKMMAEQEWMQEFEGQLRSHAMKVNPRLSWDGSKLSFNAPTTHQYDDTALWNMYKSAAQSRGYKTDVKYYEEQLKPFYKQLADNAFKEQLGALQIQNVPTKAFQDLFKNDTTYKDFFINNIQGETDADSVQMLKALIPVDEGEGLWGKVKENPYTAGVGGAIAIGASKAAYNKAKAMAEKSKKGRGGMLSKGMRSYGPALAALGVDPLARYLGATEREADILQGTANVGVGGYYGVQGFKTGRTGFTKGALSGKHLTPKQLKANAKKLGIKNIKSSKAAIQRQIASKVDNIGYAGVKKKLSEKAMKSTFSGFLKKAAARQVAGSAMPGWGNIAMAALSAADLVSLGMTLFGGEEEASTVPYSPGKTVYNAYDDIYKGRSYD